MAKPKNLKPTKNVPTTLDWQPMRRLLKPLLLVVTIVAVLLQLRYDMYVFSWSAPGHDSNNQVIIGQITSAIQGESQLAVVEPLSAKVYIPEARLVLPPYNATINDVLYGKLYDAQNSVTELNVTTKAAQNQSLAKLRASSVASGHSWANNTINHVFDKVPEAQACSRGIHVVFSKQPDQGTYLSQKSLADGRTMYLYHDSGTCSYDLTPLVKYLQQAQSY